MDKQERAISLQDLCWKIVLCWRRLLAFAVIFAVVVAAWQYVQGQKSYNDAMKKYREQTAAMESGESESLAGRTEFTDAQLAQIQDAKALQSLLDRSRTYIQKSILMNTNPYRENVLILEYYVDSEYRFNYTEDNEVDYTNAVVDAYKHYGENGGLAAEIDEELDLGYEFRYVQEIVGVTVAASMDTFTVEIIYPDQVILQKISDVVGAALQEQEAAISDSIGKHSLKLISETITVRTDSNLANYQQTYQNMVNNYRNQFNTLKNAMSAEQLAEIEMMVKEDDEEEEDAPEVELVEPVKPGIGVGNFVLGAIAGLFLAAVWITCEVLFASRLQTVEELSDMYGLRLFGTVQLTEKKSSGFDSYLLKLKNRHKKQMPQEAWIDIICSNIELVCRSENIKQVYLTGSEWEKLDAETVEHITEGLKKADIRVSCGGNICYDMVSLRDVYEVGNVILIEQENVSIYREMEKEMKTLAEQKVQILGSVGVI